MDIPSAKKYIAVGIFLRIAKSILGNRLLRFFLQGLFKKDLVANLNEKLAKDTVTSLNTLLHYADHTSMAYGVEVRNPFLDYRLVEFLASVPACYKIRNGWTKYIARLAFDGKLPDEIVWRRDKMG